MCFELDSMVLIWMMFFILDFYFNLFFQEISNVILGKNRLRMASNKFNLFENGLDKIFYKKIVTCLSHRDSHGMNMTESSKNSEFILSNKLCHWKPFQHHMIAMMIKVEDEKNKYFVVKL